MESTGCLHSQQTTKAESLLDAIRNKVYANRKLPLMVLVYSQSFQQVKA